MAAAPKSEDLIDQIKLAATNGRYLQEFLSDYSVTLDPLAHSLGLDPKEFDQLPARISLDRFCRLLDLLATVTRDDCLGLKYGQTYKLGGTGPFGYGLNNAPSFRDALRFLVRYVSINVDLDVLNLITEGEQIIVQWSVSPMIIKADQFCDYAASIIMRQLEQAAGGPIRPSEAQLRRTAPQDKSFHTRIFSSRVRFGAESNQVVLPASLLDKANPSADPVLFELMAKQCAEILEKRTTEKSIVIRVKEDLLSSLENGDTAIAAVASRLAVSERTLQRRLAQAGKTFHELFTETRTELSLRFLKETDLPLSQISRKLGYAAPSAYTRAAIRWHGKAPNLLRK